MDTQRTDQDEPLVLTGRVFAAKQMLALCGNENAVSQSDLGPYEDADPLPGDLKVSTRLDAKGKLAYQDGQNGCFISGVLCASIYDGTSWRRFDLRSITPRSSYPNPTLLERIIASVRAAAELAAGQACILVGGRDVDGAAGDYTLAAAGQRQAT